MSKRWHFARFLMPWVAAVERLALWVLAISLVVTAAAAVFAVRHLGVHTDIVEMFSPDLPFCRTDAAYRESFGHETDTLLLVVDGPTPELVTAAARALADRLAGETDLFEEAYLSRSNRFLDEHALLYLDYEELQQLSDRLARVQPFLGRLAREDDLRGFSGVLVDVLNADDLESAGTEVNRLLRAARDALDATVQDRVRPISWQELIDGEASTEDERRAVVIAKPRLDYRALLAARPALQRIREAARELQIDAAHGLRLRITGTVALRYEELLVMSRGAGLSTGLAFLLVAVVLYLGLRSIRLMVASLIALLVGLIWTAAFAALAVGHLNLISVAFGVLYIGLGIDFAIHLCLRFQELVARGHARDAAIRAAAGDVGASITMCAITTSIAFFAFVPTSFRGVSELGIIAGTGMIISLFVNLTVLPALLSRMGAPGRAPSQRTLSTLLAWPARHPRSVTSLSAALVLITLPLLTHVQFDLNPLNLRNPQSESVSTLTDLIEHGTTSPWHIVVLEHNEERLADLHAALAALDVVDRVLELRDFVPDDQDRKLALIDDLALMLGPDSWSNESDASIDSEQRAEALRELLDALDRTTERDSALGASAADLGNSIRGALERLGGLDEAGRADLLERVEGAWVSAFPAALSQLKSALQAGPVSRDTLPSIIVRQWQSANGVNRLAVFPTANLIDPDALRKFTAAVVAVAPEATGAPVINLAAADAVIDSFRQALVTALFAILLLLLIVLHNARATILVLVPVLWSGLLLAAATVLADLPFNFANVIAVPLLMGMGVDGGIHMVARYRGDEQSGHLLFTSTSRAVFYSALTTIAGFGALSLSEHPGLASLGRLLTIGIVFVLFGTLVVLPALLGLAHRRRIAR